MIIEKICCEPKYYLFTQKNMQKSEKIINLTKYILINQLENHILNFF